MKTKDGIEVIEGDVVDHHEQPGEWGTVLDSGKVYFHWDGAGAYHPLSECTFVKRADGSSTPRDGVKAEINDGGKGDRIILDDGVGSMSLSVSEAQHLSHLLAVKASEAANLIRLREEKDRLEAAAKIPVDRSAVTLADGNPVTPDHRELKENGQQKDYVVLSDSERAKGFVRPVRRTYQHVKCRSNTTMAQSIAETLARCPTFYTGGFCVSCAAHFPLLDGGNPQFFWIDDGSAVGS